jgi:hypothetical protein
MKKAFYLLGCSVLATSLLLSSCGGDSKQDTIVFEDDSNSNADMEDDEFSFVMPSALQINSIFQRSGAAFRDGVTNPVYNASKYVSKASKLFNLGIYTSDLAYVVLNDQNQLSMDYLKTIKQLSDDVGMSSIFNSSELLERFERNIGKKDSIINIMADIQEETDLYIRKSDQEHLAMVIFAGAWVEGMYLGLVTAPSDQKDILTARLLEQSLLLKNLIKGLENQPNQSEEVLQVKAKMIELRDFFNSVEGFNVDEFNFDDVKLSAAQLNELTSRLEEIRKIIISV